MSWRSTQLGNECCDQDLLIMQLFSNQTVNYQGPDREFAAKLNVDPNSTNLVLVINQLLWCSEIVEICQRRLVRPIDCFYIGINRYLIKGNDTDKQLVDTESPGQDIVDFLTTVVEQQNYTVTKSGTFDQDQGRYFNFVQPLTWIYGSKKANTSN